MISLTYWHPQVFRSVYNVEGWRQSGSNFMKQIKDTVKTYHELLQHMSEVCLCVCVAEVCSRGSRISRGV